MFDACPVEVAHYCVELAGGAIHHRGLKYSDLVPAFSFRQSVPGVEPGETAGLPTVLPAEGAGDRN